MLLLFIVYEHFFRGLHENMNSQTCASLGFKSLCSQMIVGQTAVSQTVWLNLPCS